MKQFFKTTFFAMFAAAALFLVMPSTVNASEVVPVIYQTSSEQTISPRAEQTGYYYKYEGGHQYRRLWSYTYGKWLTDWELVA